MAHEIDMSNDRANIAFVNETPWHGLGQKLKPGAKIATWKKEAGLDWEAQQAPVQFHGIGGITEFEGREVLFRQDTGLPLSVVSSRYQAVQPGEVLEFFRDLVEVYQNFTLETAGSLRGGKKIWALARANDSFSVGGDDHVARYLLLATSYDQSMPTIVQQTSIRVVCANTLAATVEGRGEYQIRINHLGKFKGDAVKERMKLTENWNLFAQQVGRLANTKVNDSMARDYFATVLYPTPSLRPSDKAVGKKVDELMSAYHEGPGQELPTAKGTAWGLVNAVTYYVDHVAKARDADLRLDKAWFGDHVRTKRQALSLACEMAE